MSSSDISSRPFESLFSIPLRNGLNRPTSVRGQGVKMVNMGELFANNRIGDLPMERVQLSEDEAAIYLLEVGDLLFARQSLMWEGAGKCSVFLGASEPTTYEGHIIRTRINKNIASPEFYYYYFNSSEGRDNIETIIEQVSAAGIRGSDLAQLEVPYLDVKEQRKIARILGALDDKIELNRRMNHTLEETARAIFKSWFVDFDPVTAKADGRVPCGMNAETASLFPAEFDETANEDFPEIPKGWKLGTFGDIAENIRRGVSPKDLDSEMPYIGLEHMPRKSIELSAWGRAGDVTSNKFVFKKGEILFGKLRPYFHKVGVAPVDGVCSTDVLVVSSKSPEHFGLMLGHVSSVDFVNFVDAASEGTKMPRTNWETMARFTIAIPAEKLSEAFTQKIMPMIKKIHTNIFEFHTLASIRDMLLPQLLSGELRVKQAEKVIEDM